MTRSGVFPVAHRSVPGLRGPTQGPPVRILRADRRPSYHFRAIPAIACEASPALRPCGRTSPERSWPQAMPSILV
jgi:hypothetical protein